MVPFVPEASLVTLSADYTVQIPTFNNDALSRNAEGFQPLDYHQGHNLECPYCAKQFTYRGNLVVHVRIHTGEKKYQCDHCFRRFSKRQNLTSHIRVHTGEQPFKCIQCGKCFARQNNLARHVNIHSGNKPHCCNAPGCDKRFASKSNLRSHEVVHKERIVQHCQYCSKGFKSPNYFKKHVQKHLASGDKPLRRSFKTMEKCGISQGIIRATAVPSINTTPEIIQNGETTSRKFSPLRANVGSLNPISQPAPGPAVQSHPLSRMAGAPEPFRQLPTTGLCHNLGAATRKAFQIASQPIPNMVASNVETTLRKTIFPNGSLQGSVQRDDGIQEANLELPASRAAAMDSVLESYPFHLDAQDTGLGSPIDRFLSTLGIDDETNLWDVSSTPPSSPLSEDFATPSQFPATPEAFHKYIPPTLQQSRDTDLWIL